MADFDGVRVIFAAGGAVADIADFANFSRRHAPAMWPPVADFRVSRVIFAAGGAVADIADFANFSRRHVRASCAPPSPADA